MVFKKSLINLVNILLKSSTFPTKKINSINRVGKGSICNIHKARYIYILLIQCVCIDISVLLGSSISNNSVEHKYRFLFTYN